MQTLHHLFNLNANNLSAIENNSIDLIVTSPPYPMVEMWDNIFIKQNPEIENDLINNPIVAYNKMHQILFDVWKECYRVLKDGGFACINIGDATRTFDEKFQLFSNHSTIIEQFQQLGFTVLPDIHWRKQTNSPNKFMGSGMYPAGAYVTYEHEYILIFRKGNKRTFSEEEKERRRESAYFWEERNEWFSDLWEIKGTKQTINKKVDRERNGSYPLEIPYRLINMYSIYGDNVLDPFAGLGTTALAAILTGRNSYSVDISKDMLEIAKDRILDPNLINDIQTNVNKRIEKHCQFINELPEDKKEKCYSNKNNSFLVKTKQETLSKFYIATQISVTNHDSFTCNYQDL